MLHWAKGFNIVNQKIREIGGNPGGRTCDLLSACPSLLLVQDAHRYVTVVQVSLSLSLTRFSLMSQSLLCLPIQNPNQYCFTLELRIVFLKALHTHTHTRTILLYINNLGMLKSYYRGHHNISPADTFYNPNLWVATGYTGEKGLEKVGGLTIHHLALVLKWAQCLHLYIFYCISPAWRVHPPIWS